MSPTTPILAIAFLTTATSVTLAQSAYTTGTIASSERAGYSSPGGYGSSLYAYAPGYGGHTDERRRRFTVY
jgi:hypothetical protein